MTAPATPVVADEVSFRRMAGLAAIASLPLAAANLVTMFAAEHFHLAAVTHPLALVHSGGQRGAAVARVPPVESRPARL